MSASQLTAIQSDQPNLLGDSFYNHQYELNLSSLTQTLTQFNDTIFLQPGGSSANIAIMPVVANLVDRTAHITNTGLNITNIDGDLIVNNGFIQSDVINVSTLNYQTLNPPIKIPAISSITASTITLQAPAPPFGTIDLYTGSSIGMTLGNGGIYTYTQNGFNLGAINSGGGAFIAQTPLVAPNPNSYYQQTWDNGSPSTRFTAGTYNGGSYHIMSSDGTVVVDNNLMVNSTITADTGILSSLTVSTLNILNPIYQPSGNVAFPDIPWNSTIGSEWVGSISTPGVKTGSILTATLHLVPGYTQTDITTAEYCWLIATSPGTDTLTFIVASDPTAGSSNVAINWAVSL